MSSTINNNNLSNFYNSMFGLNNRNSATSSLSGLLGDYASIKNGSYGKLVKAYYAKQTKETGSSNSSNSVSSKDDDKTAKNELSKFKSQATELKDAAKDLYTDRDLFEKKDITSTDAEGNKVTTKDYDREEINKKVTEFVDSYNKMIKSAGDAEDLSVLRVAANTTKRTSSNAKTLSKVGISIAKDNTLIIDKDKLNKASASDLKSLFSGSGSYAAGVASNASAIANYTSGQLSDSSLYTSAATKYNELNSSTILDYL